MNCGTPKIALSGNVFGVIDERWWKEAEHGDPCNDKDLDEVEGGEDKNDEGEGSTEFVVAKSVTKEGDVN